MQVFLIAAVMAGCAGGNHTPAVTAEPMEIEAAQLIRTVQFDESSIPVARGANDFAFRLGAAIAREMGDESMVISPYSVWLPLAALVNATDEANRPALLEALGAGGIAACDVNRAASRMLFDLTNAMSSDMHNPLHIANAVFVGDDVTIRGDFAQTFMDYYRGAVMNVDFASPDAAAAVNSWASEHTDGLITDLVSEFDPRTIAAIANAIYFSDRWLTEFNPYNTAADTFFAPNAEFDAYFMLREGYQSYFEDDALQATHINFLSGGGMFILLPKCGDAVGLLSGMTSERFEEIRLGSSIRDGKLLLPRFSIESKFSDLGETLTALGVPLFNEFTAPLTGGLVYDVPRVWLSEALQKAVIRVDEKGTTAAAVTLMVVFGESGMVIEPEEPFEMICDRPFVFVLYGDTVDGGGQVLFVGVVNEP